MNYIKKLETTVDAQRESINATEQRIRDFRSHLTSAKFIGTDEDGSRRDWIAVADVQRWLDLIDRALVTGQ